MHNDYKDIRDRISEPPRWWDSNGVPRYSEPHPHHSPNIYADRVAFYRIACQGCDEEFLVEMNTTKFQEYLNEQHWGHGEWNPEELHYGDPPNIRCCPAGPTMNCIDLELVALWERSGGGDWVLTREHVLLGGD